MSSEKWPSASVTAAAMGLPLKRVSHSHDAPTHEVSSWMTRDPKTVSPAVDVDDALRTMLHGGFRHLPVVEKGKVIGMVSMRDLAAEQQ